MEEYNHYASLPRRLQFRNRILPIEFNPARTVRKTCWMKNKIKKTNPAFKLRQVLPQLSDLPVRAGVVAKDAVKVASASPAPGAPAITWVTTE